MHERIQKLREQSLRAVPTISPERALLLTEFYQSQEARQVSIPVQRALAFKYILANKSIYVGDGELIVGERGPAPAATPTYPEVCIHSLENLEILNSREKISYKVSEETKRIYRDTIIPFWKGRSQRERIFREMTPEWVAAYDAGIFTEFQEQRGPGHTALGDKIFRKGLLDLKREIAASLASLDFYNDPEALDKKDELEAMDICADAMILFAGRHAAKLEELAAAEKDPQRKRELETMARACRRVPAHAPETFWEALQCYWFIHVGVITEINPWDSMNPGRLDQHLWPFYEKEIASSALSEECARTLLQAFWIKFHNHPAPAKVGVTAAESGTYTDFALINVGGVKPDGSDGVNDLSYLILDVVEEMRMVQPSSMAQISKKNPDRFLKRVVRVVKTGFGQPSIFNTDAIVQELLRQGKSLEDARCGGASGCVETGAFGKEAYILTGYFNLPKILEITLHNGLDPRTGRRIGLETGDPLGFKTFDELFDGYARQVRHFVDIKVRGNNVIDRLFARNIPVPFLSLLIDDCIAKGRDYHAGGARYNTSYIQGVGLGSITDALASIQQNVYAQRRVELKELLEALVGNFKNHSDLRRLILDDTPKYGNDDDRADNIMRRVFEMYYEAVNGRPNARGGVHRVNMLPTTVHVYFGSVTGAMPDGRLAGEPLSEGISPVQGADHNGPTSVLKSAAKLDHLKTGGTLLNQKFSPQLLADETGVTKVAQLIRSYFQMDGHHIQFNVVSAATLRAAQQEPEKHRDLIVRVAGYSDYFVNLSKGLQDEIIHRTEHQGV
ncbi:MAG: glycyl radical protein [Candidatus Sumerlaeota bacterium]|nr:glycyl radical protein [Candidatus Sumerlaeota bacterium]